MAAVTDGAIGRANGQAADVVLASGPEPELGSLVHNLIKGREDVVRKLDLRNGAHALRRCPNGKPQDSLHMTSIHWGEVNWSLSTQVEFCDFA